MEGAHQQVHRDHSAQRRRMFRGRAEHVQRATPEDGREQRHDGEGRGGRQRQPVGRAEAARLVRALARRPVLFALARAFGEAWPSDLSRDALVKRAFRAKQADESHRARLRVEIGRLRAELRPLAKVSATTQGFALTPRRAREVVVLAPPVEDQHAAVIAFLADGESWSSSALALALGASARTVQRALDSLVTAGKVESCGRGRARRWMTAPVLGFTTTLLLPGPLPTD